MTVTYTAEVATCKKFGCFLKLLFRWRGSIYKLVWMDLVAFLIVYYALNAIYRFALNERQQAIFENIVEYCANYGALIPLSFVLGFFVQIVMQRWWEQYMAIPWPDPIAVFVSAHIHGQNDRARLMRRTIMRYVCLCQAMVLSMISPRVKKRFPTMHHFVDAGLLLDNEKIVFDSMNESFPKIPKHWMPIVWAASIVTRARKEGLIRDDFAVKTIVDELNKFRGFCGLLMIYDSIPVPLVYTQVVTVAVYSFFLSSVMGQQWTMHSRLNDGANENRIDYFVPLFTTLQFFFYMGWLKVAESLINPFGEDDDDFEVNWIIDRNLQVSYLIVDEMHQDHPDLVKDQYWDEVFPSELPYDGDIKREEHPEPSTAKLGERLATMSTIRIDKSAHQISSNRNTEQTLDGVEESEGEGESVTLISLQPSASRLASSSRYDTAAGTPVESHITFPITESDKSLDIDELYKEQQAKAETVQPEPTTEKGRIKIMEGVFESSAEDIFETYPYEQLENEEEEREKDDFDRLKEERERERVERQKLRFVQHLEDVTNLATDFDELRLKKNSETSVPRSEHDDTDEDKTEKEKKDDDKKKKKENEEKREKE